MKNRDKLRPTRAQKIAASKARPSTPSDHRLGEAGSHLMSRSAAREAAEVAAHGDEVSGD